MGTFSDWTALEGWLKKSRETGYRLSGQWVEGFVIDDATGFQVKIKADYYDHWKSMRSLKNRILSTRRSNKPLGRDVSQGRIKAFYDWASRQSSSLLEQDLISVRRAFQEGLEQPPAEEIAPTKPSPEALGFRNALNSLARAATIKQTTADNLLAAALSSADKLSELTEHDLRIKLVMTATPGALQRAAARAVGLESD